MKLNLHNLDCMDFMAAMPDKFIDLAIVDPPYGIKQDGHRENNRSKLSKTTKYHPAVWDQQAPGPEYFKELFRVSKNQIIWGANHFIESFNRNSSCWIVWDKVNGGSHFADCELAWTSFSTAVRKFSFMWDGMRQGKSISQGNIMQGNKKMNEKRIHPTQKPVALYKWLLMNYADPSHRILDTHLGSGSIAIACLDNGNELWASEIEYNYWDAALDRVEDYQKQLKLFDAEKM
jgi:site-specific DNA-methyltransferase (adenine-specific)